MSQADGEVGGGGKSGEGSSGNSPQQAFFAHKVPNKYFCSERFDDMRVGVMVGSRYGRDKPERSVRGKAEKVEVAKVKAKAAPRKKRVKKDG